MKVSWSSLLIGKAVESVEQSEGGACIIRLSGQYLIRVESLWRLISSGTLTLTSQDNGQLFGRNEPVQALSELSSALLGHAVDAVQVRQGTADLTLHFGPQVLQVVSDSSGYEAWLVEGPAGMLAVGQGGGSVAVADGYAA